MASRPADVSPEVWLLAIALTSLVPAAIYVGMTWRVLHKMKNGTRETDQAVAVVAALSVKNAATIESFMTLLDGLENHPSIGELNRTMQLRPAHICKVSYNKTMHGFLEFLDFETALYMALYVLRHHRNCHGQRHRPIFSRTEYFAGSETAPIDQHTLRLVCCAQR